MLHSGVTKMGIAAAYSPNSKYKVFWALVLAAPTTGADNPEKSTLLGKTRLATSTEWCVAALP